MTLSFQNAKHLEAPWIHCFFYGDSGSGKTTNCATFPRPCFIVPRNESSITTLRGRDVPYYEVTDMTSPLQGGVGGMLSVIDELQRHYNNDPSKFPFDTIVVESLSHYSDLCIEQLTEGGRLQMDQRKWGQLLSHLRTLQTRLRGLDVHAVFTALAKVDAVAETGTVIGGPLIPGQAAQKIPSACDIIGYCEEVNTGKGIQYRVHFRRHKHFAARSRFPEIPPMMENFQFSQVESLLKK